MGKKISQPAPAFISKPKPPPAPPPLSGLLNDIRSDLIEMSKIASIMPGVILVPMGCSIVIPIEVSELLAKKENQDASKVH